MLKIYGLDPCHYFSYPGLSWNVVSQTTGVKLEKTSDIDKYLFIEKRSRGGISYIAKRNTKAHSKYMNVFVIGFNNINNIYGWGLSIYLPYGGFKWLKNVDGFDVMSISEKSPIGYFLEVDLKYLDELRELHNDYPLAPEKLAVSSDILSKYCKEITNLGNKTKYVLHYRNLQLYLSLGMKLTKIHKVLKFKQSD